MGSDCIDVTINLGREKQRQIRALYPLDFHCY